MVRIQFLNQRISNESKMKTSVSELYSQEILIVGLGLIGGSIARGLKAAVPNICVNACDTNEQALETAEKLGVIDRGASLEELAPSADIIILAVPVMTAIDLMDKVAALVSADCVITDVASVKSAIVAAVEKLPAQFQQRFVPAHPIAGSEQSSFQASQPELFQNRNVIIAPHAICSSESVSIVNQLWRLLGANVLGMPLKRHDEILAATSHLPHLLAYAIVDVLADQQQRENIFRYAAGGFADFSRLASSSAIMWADIFVENGEATTQVLDDYIERLKLFREKITNKEHDFLLEKFSSAKSTRDEFLEKFFNDKVSAITTQAETNYRVNNSGAVSGTIRVPGDKSISHRAIILGSIADGVTRVSGFLEGEDSVNTLKAFREMGVTIIGPDNGEVVIYGVGRDGLKAPRVPLNMGNSGTAMRLLAGLLAAQEFDSELVGDESLSKRPMGRVTNPLKEMGASIESTEKGTPPLKISGSKLLPINYEMKIASAQVKSCLLVAGIFANGETEVIEPAPCRDHTERMLLGFGYDVHKESGGAKTRLCGGGKLKATDIDVPADISSAAFFLVAASITPGSELTLLHVGMNPTRIGVINLLELMGAKIEITNERKVGGEPVADLRVTYAELTGITIPIDQIPLAIDEFPVLFVAAANAKGITELRGAEELRVKESDRIEAMAIGLKTLGISVETFPDGIRITGGEMQGGKVDSFGDHRIAMAFVVAGLRSAGPIEIENCANVATSFPGFVELANEVGIQVNEAPSEPHE